MLALYIVIAISVVLLLLILFKQRTTSIKTTSILIYASLAFGLFVIETVLYRQVHHWLLWGGWLVLLVMLIFLINMLIMTKMDNVQGIIENVMSDLLINYSKTTKGYCLHFNSGDCQLDIRNLPLNFVLLSIRETTNKQKTKLLIKLLCKKCATIIPRIKFKLGG